MRNIKESIWLKSIHKQRVDTWRVTSKQFDQTTELNFITWNLRGAGLWVTIKSINVISCQSPCQSVACQIMLYANLCWTLTHACIETAKILPFFPRVKWLHMLYMQKNLRTGRLTKWTSQWSLMQHLTTSRTFTVTSCKTWNRLPLTTRTLAT